MKQLKFESELVQKILSGTKKSTWRLFDDKALAAGDEVEFVDRGTGKVFARATLTKVYQKPFRDLTPEDQSGHETYQSQDEMLAWFARAYGKPVDIDTKVKIVFFRIH